MIDARKTGPELLSVIADAAHRHATEVDPMVSALPADQACPAALAPGLVIGDGDLERRFDRFGAGIDVKNMVQVAGRHSGQAVGQLEGLGMTHLEGGGVVELGRLGALHMAPVQTAASDDLGFGLGDSADELL